MAPKKLEIGVEVSCHASIYMAKVLGSCTCFRVMGCSCTRCCLGDVPQDFTQRALPAETHFELL
jgi:hypothetical protein